MIKYFQSYDQAKGRDVTTEKNIMILLMSFFEELANSEASTPLLNSGKVIKNGP